MSDEKKQTSTGKFADVYAALANFQSIVPIIEKRGEAKGEKFDFNYARLDDIQEAIREPLKKSELVYYWEDLIGSNGEHIKRVVVVHPPSGTQLISAEVLDVIPMRGMNSHQSKGAAKTYVQRYLLISILGLTVRGDDTVEGAENERGDMGSAPKAPTKWLNRTTKSGEITAEWKTAVKKLATGELTIGVIKQHRRISRANEEALMNEAFADAPPSDQSNLPGREFPPDYDREAGAEPDKPNTLFDK